ncbi:MAG: hypothetical protein AAGA57_08140 [Planctomycetota bacterium]
MALAAAALVTVIGLGVMAVARVEGESARLQAEVHDARYAARGGLELALRALSQMSDWRTDATTGAWSNTVSVNGARWRWRLDDVDDGVLGAGSDRNVWLTCWAESGRASRTLRVQLDTDDGGAPLVRAGSFRGSPATP